MTTRRRLYLVNQSTLVSTAELRRIVAACNKQVSQHAAPAWGVERVIVEARTGTLESVQATTLPGSWVIGLFDTIADAGALGWHSVDDQSRVYGQIAAKPSLDAGSTVLTGTYAVSSVVSHEVLETLCDRYCTGWADTARGYLVALEVCDPVEADGYLIDGVQVSNFVLPAWFNAYAAKPAGPFDHLGKLAAPFAMTPGGYWVQQPSGRETQTFKRTREWLGEVGFDVVKPRAQGVEVVFSPEMPQWRRELKLAGGRNAIKRGEHA